MTKGGMPDVVAKRYGFDKVEIKPQRATDSPCDTRNQLHVQASMRDVVVFVERKDLCFVRIAVVIGTVQNFVDVANERATERACIVVGVVFSAQRTFFVARNGRKIARFLAF